MEQWAEKLNVPLPQCRNCGICCTCATPSESYKKLLERAANGDQFARDFFSIFVPYANIDEARKVSNEIVEQTIKSCQSGENNIPLDELVFYKCRHHHPDGKCLIYENRPQLCRNFPGTPYVMLDKRCAFYDWAQKCKKAYNKLNEDLKELKKHQEKVKFMKEQRRLEDLYYRLKNLKDPECKFMLTVPSMCVVSPACSWIKQPKT